MSAPASPFQAAAINLPPAPTGPSGAQQYAAQFLPAAYGPAASHSAPANAPGEAVRPVQRQGLPWFIAGSTFLIIAFTQMMLIPHWMETKSSNALVGNLTGLIVEVGIGAALLAVGFNKRRQS